MAAGDQQKHVVAPGGTIGILGGGQLGRMMALAAAELGLKIHIYAPEETSPAAEVSAFHTKADYDVKEALETFADSVDVVTYEFENVPAETARILSDHCPVFPGPRALAVAQNRLVEKTFLNENDIATAPFADVRSLEDLTKALETIGTPSVLKTQTLGYDGKGQFILKDPKQAEEAWTSLKGAPCILEGFIAFDCEVSCIAARDQDGKVELYDVVRNVHKNHILHQTFVPAELDEELMLKAHDITHKTLDALEYVGVMAVEMFACTPQNAGEPNILVNEIAPRVHNSGHWTQDAAYTCQFEQHIRAVAGWPLGSAKRHHNAVMTNLLGHDVDDWSALASKLNTHVHLYGKNEAREGRKMGHVTELLPLK